MAEVLNPAKVARPCFLQINQAGSWRSALQFDAGDVPPEFLEHADSLMRLAGSGERASMRVVMATQTSNGSFSASQDVLMRWTRAGGWSSEP
jgi:hypothetical protein